MAPQVTGENRPHTYHFLLQCLGSIYWTRSAEFVFLIRHKLLQWVTLRLHFKPKSLSVLLSCAKDIRSARNHPINHQPSIYQISASLKEAHETSILFPSVLDVIHSVTNIDIIFKWFYLLLYSYVLVKAACTLLTIREFIY